MRARVDRARVRAQAVARYATRRSTGGAAFIRSMLDAHPPGRGEIRVHERELALRTDTTLRTLGVRCLWRAAIVTDLLRSNGVAAHVGLVVSSVDPRKAHAECEVNGMPLRPFDAGSVKLR